MEKSLFEQMGGTYHQEGDYFLPDLSIPELPAIGIWGQRRRRYLKEHCQALYTALLLADKLNDHLSEIDKQAESMFFQLVKQMAKQEGTTEQLKADSQMEWVGMINNIRSVVMAIIDREVIYS
ncbi:TnpV protein [Pseudoflavonifractor phocaeensis]|nr:TnpV protein [Pseudoflavonifractor phocaeensis]MCF2675255.1 TnpV protein [Pseudoflavonifractor phocaeensis]